MHITQKIHKVYGSKVDARMNTDSLKPTLFIVKMITYQDYITGSLESWKTMSKFPSLLSSYKTVRALNK